MKILLLASGGDAPGMNRVIYELYKKLGKSIYACVGGFSGLMSNKITPLKNFNLKAYKNESGVCIKSSRTSLFKTERGFKQGLKNAKNFDWVIILGGNGSKAGAEKLSENGIKTIFVPATIDNDIIGSDYSLGFHTAVKACCNTIFNLMNSINSFENQCCIFEVMGRGCGKIAENVAKIVEADFLITQEKDIKVKNILQIMKKNSALNKTTLIIIKEKIIESIKLANELNERYPEIYTRYYQIGLLQRSFSPSKIDLKKAKELSEIVLKILKYSNKSSFISFKEGQWIYE